MHLRSLPLKTNTVSNTAFRGFGGPQGMVAGERLIEEIAYALGKDPLEVRKLNFYGEGPRNVTPYHQTVEDNVIAEIVAELEQSADYWGRRQAIREQNAKSRVIKRGLALTPVKFGISFTATQYNQAGALVHVYTDGSIHLNHGGTEMGQGLYTKVAQVVAEEFQVDVDQVRITATTTAKVPNTSATAASSGSDLNGKAAQAAARTIKGRLVAFAAEHWGVPQEQIEFLPGRVRVGNQEILFRELIWQAYLGRVSLSSTGFYKTPKIHWDRASGRGRPFYYFAYGAAVSEVAVDTLTGEYKVERVDILHEVGRSLNPALDIGQIEGGFVQGMGWLTTEELWWDREGRLRTHAPSTYKIPACSDRPRIFNVRLLENTENREDTIFKSKAVGEPPLMLAISVLHALSDAIASTADYKLCPRLDPPATPEAVLTTIERLEGTGAPAEAPDDRAGRDPSPAARRAGARGAGAGGARQGLDARARRASACWSRPRPCTARSAAAGSSGTRSPAPANCWPATETVATLEVPLGPAVGQCCGGHVTLSLARAGAAELAELEAAAAAGAGGLAARACCSAPATSARRSPGRSPPCRSGCAGSTAGRTRFRARRPRGPRSWSPKNR